MSRNSTPVMAHNSLQESSESFNQSLDSQSPKTEPVDNFTCVNDSSVEDQETKSSGSTVSSLRAVKPLKLKSPITCKHISFRSHHFSEPFSPRSTVLSNADIQSTLTSSSELEFRKDLATLDADIARLQMQFRIARHGPEQAPHGH